jgi:hypothetical protein
MVWRSTNSPREKKVQLQKSGVKMMLIVFFDIRGIIHKEFVPQGATDNSHCYMGVMQRLYERMRRVRRDLFDANSWQLLRDNAPPHCALNLKRFLVKKAITTIEEPPHLPDLAPANYFSGNQEGTERWRLLRQYITISTPWRCYLFFTNFVSLFNWHTVYVTFTA